MAKESTIQHYNSSTQGNLPSAVDLAAGEIAINTADEKVFLKNAAGTVLSLSQTKDLSGNFAKGSEVVSRINVGLFGASFTGTVGLSAGGAIKITTTTNPQRITIAGSYTLKGQVGTLPFTDSTLDDFAADSNLKFDYLGDLSFYTPGAIKLGRTYSSSGLEFGDGTTQSTAYSAANSVNSVNGCTGAITITGTVNEVEVTKTCPQVVIGLPDNVSIPYLSATAATFNSRVTMRGGLTTANLWVSTGATFGASKIDLTSTTATVQGYSLAGYLKLQSVSTSAALGGTPSIVLQDADTDIGGIPSITINPTSTGVGTVSIGNASSSSTFSGTNTFSGTSTFSVRSVHSGGVTAANLWVSTGATFGSRSSFSSGLTTANLWVSNGATFGSRSSFSSGITTTDLWVSAGATFGGNISARNIVNSVNGLTGAVTVSTGISWSVGDTDRSLTANTGLFANKGTLLTLTLPVSSSIGDTIKVSGMTAGLWKIAQNASQVIHFGKSDTTVGTSGYLQSTLARDSVEMVCCVTNNEWNVVSAVGNITIA